MRMPCTVVMDAPRPVVVPSVYVEKGIPHELMQTWTTCWILWLLLLLVGFFGRGQDGWNGSNRLLISVKPGVSVAR